MEGSTGVPLLGGNDVAILNNGDEFYPAMLAAVRGARRSITIEAYIYWRGEIGLEFAQAIADAPRPASRSSCCSIRSARRRSATRS